MSDTTRHYCHKCGKKKQERFMEIDTQRSILAPHGNGRPRWKCKNDCNQEEHRRYGRKWTERSRYRW